MSGNTELNSFDDIFGSTSNTNPFENMDNIDNIFNTTNDEPFPWDTPENPFESITAIDGTTSPIIFGEETTSVLEAMTSPGILNSKLDKEVGNNIYMDTLKLIQKVEILLGNTKTSYEINKKEAIKFINSRIAMRALSISMEYKRLLGENQTYQYLLDKMKPFDGSMQQVIHEKENEIKRLQVELDLYKLKTTQTEKQMVDLRKVYETRRKEDFNRVKIYLEKGVELRNSKQELEEENKLLKSKNISLKEKYKDCKKTLRYATAESMYQKKQKIKARKAAEKIKNQLSESFHNSASQESKLMSISKRINALNFKYPGLRNHFKDFFEVDNICDCAICMDEISSNENYHTCSNSSCGLTFHVNCLRKMAEQMEGELNKCQYCQVIDRSYPSLLSDNIKELDDSLYESDGDDDFVQGGEINPITQRDIDRFQSHMFLSAEEIEAQQAEEEDDQELDPDYDPDEDDATDIDDEDDATDSDDEDDTADSDDNDAEENEGGNETDSDSDDLSDDEIEILYVLTE